MNGKSPSLIGTSTKFLWAMFNSKLMQTLKVPEGTLNEWIVLGNPGSSDGIWMVSQNIHDKYDKT